MAMGFLMPGRRTSGVRPWNLGRGVGDFGRLRGGSRCSSVTEMCGSAFDQLAR